MSFCAKLLQLPVSVLLALTSFSLQKELPNILIQGLQCNVMEGKEFSRARKCDRIKRLNTVAEIKTSKCIGRCSHKRVQNKVNLFLPSSVVGSFNILAG